MINDNNDHIVNDNNDHIVNDNNDHIVNDNNDQEQIEEGNVEVTSITK